MPIPARRVLILSTWILTTLTLTLTGTLTQSQSVLRMKVSSCWAPVFDEHRMMMVHAGICVLGELDCAWSTCWGTSTGTDHFRLTSEFSPQLDAVFSP